LSKKPPLQNQRFKWWEHVTELALRFQLWTYLADINEQAQERFQVIISQMQKAESVTEKMKADNQWEWIQRMGSIHNRAEKIVLNELIYSC
jgi:hypothetical protein